MRLGADQALVGNQTILVYGEEARTSSKSEQDRKY